MRSPVRVVETGKVYDEASIANWFALGKNTCPCTGQRLRRLDYVPEAKLQKEIEQWIEQTGYTEVKSNCQTARVPV